MSQGNHVAGSTYIDDVPETEREVPKCEACLEESDFRTELGIYRLNLNPRSMVCSSCLSELHEETIINLTE